jgi:formylglycine-generating enzyme required for sulfatase activity/energy-coupling factor transporter ATP-binding protein EcfA2
VRRKARASIPKAGGSDRVAARRRYLRCLKARLERLDLSAIGPTSIASALRDVYVDLPVPLWVSVSVENERVRRWTVTGQDLDLTAAPDSARAVLGVGFNARQLEDLYKLLQTDLDRRATPAAVDDWAQQGRPIVLAPPWHDGVKPFLRQLSVSEVLAVLRKAVVVGPPGAGKSTVLKYLALVVAATGLASEATRDRVGPWAGWEGRDLSPLYVDLGHFVRWPRFPHDSGQITEGLFWDYVAEVEGPQVDSAAIASIHRDLQDGRGLILLDGLDEIPTSAGSSGLRRRREQMAELARVLSTAYEPSPIIFSSREYGYRDWSIEGFSRVPLAPLATRDIRTLLGRAYCAGGIATPDADKRTKAFLTALESVPKELKERPLFLILLATVFERDPRRGLPDHRGTLYRECIDLLLQRWTRGRRDQTSLADRIGCTAEDLYGRLACIAYKTQETTNPTQPERAAIDEQTIIAELFKLEEAGDRLRAVDALAFLSQHVGILVSPEGARYAFLHRGFQEYLAASWLAADASVRDYSKIRHAIESQPTIWREPCLMLGDILGRAGGDDSRWTLLENLVDAPPSGPIAPDDPRAWSVWLTAHLVNELLPHATTQNRFRRQLLDDLRAWMAAVVGRAEALPPIERTDLAMTLGKLGDPRPGTGLSNGVPDLLWCDIPAGSQTIGLDPTLVAMASEAEWARGWRFERETPARQVAVSAFCITRYPITQAQFAAFVTAGGYDKERYWTAAGWVWRKAFAVDSLGVQKWGTQGNLPVTNVSWHEAAAFAAWYSDATGSSVRMPTAVEWERAARGDDGRLFPWGNTFEPSRANCLETGIGRVCPVGLFPADDGAWGKCTPWELSGNIWEWCDDSAVPTDKVSSEPAGNSRVTDTTKGVEMKLTKGGAYLNVPFLLKPTYSGKDFPWARYSRQGFRLVWFDRASIADR